jgi:hypothetical protein
MSVDTMFIGEGKYIITSVKKQLFEFNWCLIFIFQDATKWNGIIPQLVDSIRSSNYRTNAYVIHYSVEDSIEKWQGTSTGIWYQRCNIIGYVFYNLILSNNRK